MFPYYLHLSETWETELSILVTHGMDNEFHNITSNYAGKYKKGIFRFFFHKKIKLRSQNFPSLTARKSLVMTENIVGLDLKLLPSKVKALLNLSQYHAFKSIE